MAAALLARRSGIALTDALATVGCGGRIADLAHGVDDGERGRRPRGPARSRRTSRRTTSHPCGTVRRVAWSAHRS